MNSRRLILSFAFIVTFSFVVTAAHAVELKCASLAPVGSTYANMFTEFAKAITSGTGGQVKISLYNGGVMGDEKDMYKKLQIGQLDCAGFTGMGLGFIDPAVRIMELPFLFTTYSQVDKAFNAVGPSLKQRIAGKGFELIGWAHPGFVKIYSKGKIASKKDMTGKKIWIWSGDRIAEAMTKSLGLNAVPLGLPDVLTSLQTGMIDTVYAPELAAIALQWYTKTKFITDLNLTHSMGGLVITKRGMNKLNASQKQVMRTKGAEIMQRLTTQTRAENDKSLQAMLSAGMKKVPVDAKELVVLQQSGATIETQLSGSMFPASLLSQVKAAR
jgi:TRAP-type C4-dicarboxylate transport system substrate-binding protein